MAPAPVQLAMASNLLATSDSLRKKKSLISGPRSETKAHTAARFQTQQHHLQLMVP